MTKSFRPTLIPTLFTIPALIVLVTLGTWQLHRLQWKEAIIAEITQQKSLPVMNLNSANNTDGLQYRLVQVTGELLPDKNIFLYTGPKEFKGEAGYDIFSPLKMADGLTVLIDRGWIPESKKHASDWQQSGPVTIVGTFMKGEKKALFTPDNNLQKNIWFWIDLSAIREYLKMDIPNFYIMQAEGKDKNALPIGRSFSVDRIRNDHLQYAITWYSAALSLLVIYFLYHRKRR